MTKKEITEKKKEFQLALLDVVKNKLLVVRQQQVLLDADVANIYGVETREVNQAVRNIPISFRKDICSELKNRNLQICGQNF